MCVQYMGGGGHIVNTWVCSVPRRDIMGTSEKYHDSCGGIMSISGVVQYIGFFSIN